MHREKVRALARAIAAPVVAAAIVVGAGSTPAAALPVTIASRPLASDRLDGVGLAAVQANGIAYVGGTFTHVLDHKGKTVFEKDLPADPDEFLHAIKPYRKNIVVGCECMFAWYWLADLCEDEKIPFVLGHALAMKHIHGGKAKSDRIDAGKLATFLRGGTRLTPSPLDWPPGR